MQKTHGWRPAGDRNPCEGCLKGGLPQGRASSVKKKPPQLNTKSMHCGDLL